MPSDILTSQIFTLIYLLSLLNDSVAKFILKSTKINIFITLTIASWVSTAICTLFNTNFPLVLALLTILFGTMQGMLYHYSDSNKDRKPKPYIISVETIFENTIGTVTSKIGENQYLGKIMKDNIMQDILIYSKDELAKDDKFKLIAFEGDKIIAEKYFGTDFVNINKKDDNNE